MARRMMWLEHKHEPLLPHSLFLQRMLNCTFIAVSLLFLGSFLGAIGYHYLENQSWLEGLLNSVMIMTGLGLSDSLNTTAGKIFTIVYSLLSPLIFYSTLVIFFTPLLHRLLHHFHLELDKDKD